MQPRRRDIRRIGFQHDRAQRQITGQASNLQSAWKSHGTAKAKFETKFDKCLRLLHTAVEGVCNTSGYLDATQIFKYLVLRTTHMQQDWQIEITRDFQLFAIKEGLLFAHFGSIQHRHKKIQTNFTDGDKTL